MHYVRRMTERDLESVFTIINLNLDDYFAPEVVQFFLLQWPEGQFVAADLSGRVVGALCGARLDPSRASVSLLAVEPQCRGSGAGGALMDALERTCLMNGITRLQLEVRTENSAAQRFYSRRGYRITESLPHFYNDGGDGYRMVKDLRGLSPS